MDNLRLSTHRGYAIVSVTAESDFDLFDGSDSDNGDAVARLKPGTYQAEVVGDQASVEWIIVTIPQETGPPLKRGRTTTDWRRFAQRGYPFRVALKSDRGLKIEDYADVHA